MKSKNGFFRLVCVSAMTLFCLLLSAAAVSAQTLTLDSLQRRFNDQRFGMFLHFNMNTYSPGWGNNRVDPRLFNPTSLNCAQWAAAAAAAKMKWAVLTCKHHDGFVIWQSTMAPLITPAYTIAQSSTPTLDVAKSYTDAFRAAGIMPGLYMSGWDVAQGITQSITKWTAAQRTYVLGQIRELLTKYGEIPIFWFDGYSWAMGHWAFPWQEIRDTIKALQPNCVIVETNGMNEPWESDILFIEEPLGNWVPAGNTYAACQAQTITGGWFWASGYTLMTVANIMTTHLNALNPRYCSFLLNCPPNRAGQLDAAIVTRLTEVGTAWTPPARLRLPTQQPMIERPITPASATATSGTAFNAIDNVNDWTGSAGGHFQTLWQSSGTLPQSVTLNLGKSYNYIERLFYLPSRNTTHGYITSYRIYVSTDGTNFTQVTSGTWAADATIKRVSFATQTAQYVRLEAVAVSDGTSAVAGEVAVGGGPIISAVKEPVSKRTFQSPGTSVIKGAGKITLDPSFAGRTKSVSVYDLGGKLVGVKTLSKNSMDLQKDFGVPEGVYIVKVKAAQ